MRVAERIDVFIRIRRLVRIDFIEQSGDWIAAADSVRIPGETRRDAISHRPGRARRSMEIKPSRNRPHEPRQDERIQNKNGKHTHTEHVWRETFIFQVGDLGKNDKKWKKKEEFNSYRNAPVNRWERLTKNDSELTLNKCVPWFNSNNRFYGFSAFL